MQRLVYYFDGVKHLLPGLRAVSCHGKGGDGQGGGLQGRRGGGRGDY